MDPRIALLLRLIDTAFDAKSWHGTNLRGSIRGLPAGRAGWRLAPRRHTIAEIALHTAYWKYAVRRRLRGDARGSFALKGSNWFPQPEPLTEADWKHIVRMLVEEHRSLRATVAGFDARRLDAALPPNRTTALDLVHGIAAHDLYHAGQIQVLKRLSAAGA